MLSSKRNKVKDLISENKILKVQFHSIVWEHFDLRDGAGFFYKPLRNANWRKYLKLTIFPPVLTDKLLNTSLYCTKTLGE